MTSHIARKTMAITADVVIGGVGYAIYSFSVPIKTVRIDHGAIGVFQIGETKEEILARLPNEEFGPQPKPSECPRNWIKVSASTDTERRCLLTSDKWIEGVDSDRSVCPEHVDVVTTLKFESNRLTRITIECWHPQ